MKLSDGVYAVGDLHQKSMRVSYGSALGPLSNKGADDLQTVCNPVIGFSSVILTNTLSINVHFDPRLHVWRLDGVAVTAPTYVTTISISTFN